MKKSLFYLFMLMAVVAMPLTSCEKDPQKEDGQHDPFICTFAMSCYDLRLF